MQCMGLVTSLLAAMLFAGCAQKEEHLFDAQKPLSGCNHIDSSKEAEIIIEAKSFFLEQVGVKISSLKVSRPSVCFGKTVVPIEAVTENSNVPRIWFVEISGENSKKMDLIRPD